MTKITLTDLVNLENQTTAVTAINNNNAVIETAFDNTLSRDGTSPNTMSANLDMNSKRVLNVPDAISAQEPATLNQVNQLVNGGTLIVEALPPGGTTGQVLKKNSNTDFDVSFGSIGAVAMPAFTGDVTTSAGAVATTIANDAVTNTKLANMAAFTLKGNNTSGSADPSDISISGLTSKTPANSDLILISDEAASHAFKKATLATSAVTSIAGNRGDFTLTNGLTNSGNAIGRALNEAVLQTTLADPAGAGASNIMMGMGTGAKLTPVYSTRIKVEFLGFIINTATAAAAAQLRFGTGTAPTNGAAATGTQIGANIQNSNLANGEMPFCASGIATGLTPGTQYWFDMALTTATGTAHIQNISFNAFEF